MSKARKTVSVISAVTAVLFALLIVCSIPLPASAEKLTGKTANELMAELDLGWNLGNTLDATGGNGTLEAETSWGNPKTTKAMIDAVKAQGFNTMRLPVSWGSHMTNSSAGYVIDSQWMARVKEIVDYAIDNDMYVILNIHHDNDIRNSDDCFFYPSETYKTQSVAFVKAVWTQISETFKDYDQHLIFETLNEPRLVGTGDEWWFPVDNPGTNVSQAISIINELNQQAVNVIRASGGNNAERCIMIPGYGASIDGCTTPNYQLPTDTADDRLIVSVHAYTPYNFALNASGTSVFSDDLKPEVDYLFSTLKSKFLDKNIPVVIGEASASNKGNASERLKWANYYMGKSASLGIPVMLWDNNVYTGSSNLGEQHGYLNRLTLTWNDKDVVDAMVSCYGNEPSSGGDDDNGGGNNDMPTDSEVLFTGTASAEAWKQATFVTTIKNENGTLDPSIIKEGGYFYVEYTGNVGQIELIMQSWSGGTEWAKINLCESGMAGNNYYAKFSYADCVAAFGGDFATYLDRVYVGALNGTITVYSLSYETPSAEEPATPPAAVSGFTSPSKAITAIRLNWTADATATGYIIEQYTNGNWVQIADVTDGATATYKVTGLIPGTIYKFRMAAYNDDGISEYTDVLTESTRMTEVKSFRSPSQSTSAIRLNWTENAYADGYIIEQYNGSAWVQIADITDKSTTTYKVTGLKSGTAYKFKIKAYSVNDGGETVYGPRTSTLTANTKAASVTGLALKSRSSTALRLKWTKNTEVDGYIIEQMIDDEWVQIADIDDYKTTEYKVTGLSASTKYSFRMKAYAVTKYGEKTYSSYTGTLSKTTNPSVVSGLRVKSRSDKAIRLAWTENTSADGYLIEQYIDGKWVQIADVDKATTEYKVTGLAVATEYQFRARTYNMVGETALYSEYKTVNGTTLS